MKITINITDENNAQKFTDFVLENNIEVVKIDSEDKDEIKAIFISKEGGENNAEGSLPEERNKGKA